MVMSLQVREWRKRRGMSLEKLAEAAGISRSYLNEIELGKKTANENRMRQIARALDVRVEDLLAPRERRELEETLLRLLEQLPPDEQRKLIRIAEALAASNDVPPTPTQ